MGLGLAVGLCVLVFVLQAFGGFLFWRGVMALQTGLTGVSAAQVARDWVRQASGEFAPARATPGRAPDAGRACLDASGELWRPYRGVDEYRLRDPKNWRQQVAVDALRDEGGLVEAAFPCAPWYRLDFSGEMPADLSGTDLRGSFLTGSNLRAADLGGVRLAYASLRSRPYTTTDLRKARLTGADLRYADFWDVDLTGADLSNADARQAWFQNATLKGADLADSDLRGAVFTGAVLGGATFAGALLENASFGLADLRDADLSQAHTGDQTLAELFDTSCFDATTAWPGNRVPDFRPDDTACTMARNKAEMAR